MTLEEAAICRQAAEFSMTGPERLLSVVRVVEYLARNRLQGAIVECGVWRGGSSMAAALALQRLGETRDLYLYDTFEGMPEPSPDLDGRSANDQFAAATVGGEAWFRASIDEVRRNLAGTGYPMDRVHLVPGRVEETLPASAPPAIGLLRLDTDWYSSTRHELVHLYPRLVAHGVLIVDDYGHWQGARKATDEYFAALVPCPFLHRIDYTARLAIKI